MNGFDKNKKPDQKTIEAIEFFMRVSSDIFRIRVAMPSHRDLVYSTAVKMAKEIGRLEDLDSEEAFENEIQYYKEFLVSWIAHGWIKNPLKIEMEGFFNNPDNACPNCGWKNDSSKRVTTCFNCQTGMIMVDGKWYKVNDYIDPEGFYIPALYKHKTVEIDKIKNKQQEFFKNPKNISVPLGYHDFVQEWKKFSLKCHYQKQWDQGLIAIVEAINIDPLNITLWQELVEFGMSSSFIDISFIASKLMMNLKPDDYETISKFKRIFKDKNNKLKLFQQGFAIYERGEFEKGLSYYCAGLKIKGHNEFDGLIFYGLGLVYFYLEKFNKAKTYFEKALKEKLSHPASNEIKYSSYFKIGQIDVINCKFTEGYNNLIKALHIHPTDHVVKNWIDLAEKGIKDPKNTKMKLIDPHLEDKNFLSF